MNINRSLQRLEKEGTPIRVGLVGAGQMGSSLIAIMNRLPGMRVVAVADVDEGRARDGCLRAGVEPSRIRSLDGPDVSSDDVDVVRVTGDVEQVAADASVDVIVEATGHPDVGAHVASVSIREKKHVVMLNAETDATVGAVLAHKAEKAGVVYTGASGDEPAAIMELYNFADALGLHVLVAGKGKNNPLRRDATPDQLEARAKQEGASARMLCSFVDGTKTMVEMTCVANAIGFVPDVPGMHGIKGGADEVLSQLRLRDEGGILGRYGVVEYVDGLAPGVFIIVRAEQQLVVDTMRYLKMGDGPNFFLYRPYHLTSVETPISIARAVLRTEPTICTTGAPAAETVAMAKKDLAAGEQLDGIGGYTVYGQCYTVTDAGPQGFLPLGLVVPGTRVVRPVKVGTPLTYEDVEIPPSTIGALRQEQDAMQWSSAPVERGVAATPAAVGMIEGNHRP